MARTVSSRLRKATSRSDSDLEMVKAPDNPSSSSNENDFDPDDHSTHLRRPTANASPLRCASSIGFASDSSSEADISESGVKVPLCSVMGILHSVAFPTHHPGDAVSMKDNRSAIADLKRPRSKQIVNAKPSTFAIDVVLLDPTCRDKDCQSHNNDFPLAAIQAIKQSRRFRPVSETGRVYEREAVKSSPSVHAESRLEIETTEKPASGCSTDACSGTDNSCIPNDQSTITVENMSATTQAIMADEAVLGFGEIKNIKPREPLATSVKKDEYASIMGKLKLAGKNYQLRRDAGLCTLASQPPPMVRNVRHFKEHSTSSEDSGIVVNSLDNGKSLKKQPSTTSLNPAAAEFVVDEDTIEDPAIIEQSLHGRVERNSESTSFGSREYAIAKAFDDVAEYSKNSFSNLQEVVHNTIERFGLPGFNGLPSLPLHNELPHSDFTSQTLDPNSIVHNSFAAPNFPAASGIMNSWPQTPSYAPSVPLPPPGYGPGSGFGPGPGGPQLDWDHFLPPGQPQAQAWMPPLPFPPCMPPLPLPPCMPFSQPLQPPGFSVSQKPRCPDAAAQQAYEAHLEWRKANEPGYALKCKERQARRAHKYGIQSSTDTVSSF